MQGVTPWFNGSILPYRKGLYQRERRSVIIYSYWNGEYWCVGSDNAHLAMNFVGHKAKHQFTDWRGLLTKTKHYEY